MCAVGRIYGILAKECCCKSVIFESCLVFTADDEVICVCVCLCLSVGMKNKMGFLQFSLFSWPQIEISAKLCMLFL